MPSEKVHKFQFYIHQSKFGSFLSELKTAVASDKFTIEIQDASRLAGWVYLEIYDTQELVHGFLSLLAQNGYAAEQDYVFISKKPSQIFVSVEEVEEGIAPDTVKQIESNVVFPNHEAYVSRARAIIESSKKTDRSTGNLRKAAKNLDLIFFLQGSIQLTNQKCLEIYALLIESENFDIFLKKLYLISDYRFIHTKIKDFKINEVLFENMQYLMREVLAA
jgi:hypothetical protein